MPGPLQERVRENEEAFIEAALCWCVVWTSGNIINLDRHKLVDHELGWDDPLHSTDQSPDQFTDRNFDIKLPR